MKWFVSTKGMIIMVAIFLLVIVGFNVYDFGSDHTDKRAYTKDEIESMNIEKINLNTSTVEQLCDVPGISDKTAHKIVMYREKNGGFESVEELENISGISKNKVMDFKPFFTV